ncbi:MAG: Rnf-Nqr domain containing protein, partial [Candidatus Methylopumilus sp.]
MSATSENNPSETIVEVKAAANKYGEIVENGLWKQNAGIVQLLGLCPTLAMTVTLVNGFSLG